MANLPSQTHETLRSLFRDESVGPKARDFHRDERGAIMMIGCFMACFLIGALWSIIGIGDAIVFRDSMQEVADHAAFTSAVLHAKGMNFISACNLVMLAFIFFHILFGIINDILFLACLVPVVDIVACPAFEVAHNVYVDYGNDVMKPACTGIHYAEMVAGYGYPWLGTLKGYTLGTDYGQTLMTKKRDLHVFVVSPSLVPGTILDRLVNSVFPEKSLARRRTGQVNKEKLGLPVAAYGYNDICKHIAVDGLNALLKILTPPYLDIIKKPLEDLIGIGIQFRYCNSLGYNGAGSTDPFAKPDVTGQVGKVNGKIDKLNKDIDAKNAALPAGATPAKNIAKMDTDPGGKGLAQIDPALDQWWGHDGPYYPWNGTSNGAPWNEVWALNLRPEYVDRQEHAVALAKGVRGQSSTSQAAFAYIAEAEFYFDCDGVWSDSQCNSNNNAGFSVQWRARLRRTELPQIMDLLTSYGGDFLGNTDALGKVFSKVRDKILSALPIKGLQGLLTPMFKIWKSDLQKYIEKEANGLGKAGDSALSGIGDGVFH